MPKKKPKPGNPDGAIVDDSAIRLSNDFGERIALLCRVRDISVAQLEEACGLSRGSLNAIVSGRRAGRLSAWIAVLVADALHADIGFLITGRSHDSSSWQRTTDAVSPWPRALPRLAKPLERLKGKPPAPKPRSQKPQR
jgi:transcriptional regulator with XRE-family HTH domain